MKSDDVRLGRRSPRRMSVVLSITLITIFGVIVACGDTKNNAAGNGSTQPPTSSTCLTPDMNCPCSDPGNRVACGKKVTGDQHFIYCYEGTRTCMATGVWSDCLEGNISPRSIASTSLKTAALASTSSVCAGSVTGPLKVCNGGKKKGDFCNIDADCTGGEKICTGDILDQTKKCKDDADCNLICGLFNGKCDGASLIPNLGCFTNLECVGGLCNAPGGGNLCLSYPGICDTPGGPEDTDECNTDADCGAGTCDIPNPRGVCIGGKRNGKKCKKNNQCPQGGVCSAGGPTGDGGSDAGALDPCDPYCNVYSDTPIGFDAGPGFVLIDGGLTTKGCGDGALDPGEACDDGNTTPSDGCSASCTLEPGYQCPTPGSPCTLSTCGNMIVEGTEQCDDGNIRPYDGCFNCQREVTCPASGPCTPICGDGYLFPGELCDDGNLTPGDGCDATCTPEMGATCTPVTAPAPAFLDVPVIYRDFRGTGQGAGGHVDFQQPGVPHAPYAPGACVGGPTICTGGGVRQGIPSLDISAVDKEPVFLATQGIVGAGSTFDEWYHDVPAVNQTILGRFLRLQQIAAGTYQYDSDNDYVTLANINCGDGTAQSCSGFAPKGFWPIDGMGQGNYGSHNFHFTSEVRYPFTYKGGEVLSFTGDDDVFVYIGGKKVVDIGGIHGAQNGSVTLALAGFPTAPPSTPVTLTVGQTYEIIVFQAERNTTGSNYRLTLSGFEKKISQCTIPTPPATLVRDFEGVCPAGTRVVWQLFRWKAGATGTQTIDYKAATEDTQAALPALPTAPTVVPIGAADSANSPAAGPIVWTYDANPVSYHLNAAAPPQLSKSWLRVFMTFNGTPTLYEWQQLYDCVPSE